MTDTILPMSDEIVLCQDCLRIAAYSDARHEGDELCSCGGELCGCHCCVDTANKLLAGERRAVKLGTQTDIGEWSADQGCAEPPR